MTRESGGRGSIRSDISLCRYVLTRATHTPDCLFYAGSFAELGALCFKAYGLHCGHVSAHRKNIFSMSGVLGWVGIYSSTLIDLLFVVVNPKP